MPTHWFLEAYAELQRRTPRLGLLTVSSENSQYTNYSSFNKNCYLCFGVHYSEDCYYVGYSVRNRDCADCEDIEASELMYECLLCEKCYNCTYSAYLMSCSEVEYSWDMTNCTSCFLCTGLQNTSYCFMNERLSPEAYLQRRTEYLANYSPAQLLEQLELLRQRVPQRMLFQKNCEDSVGPDLRNCRNMYYSFAAKNSEDCLYTMRHVNNVKDGIDIECAAADPSEVLYNSIGISGGQNIHCSWTVWFSHDIFHSEQIWNSHDLLGCVGRSHAEYEILNEKYAPEAYDRKFNEIKTELLALGLWNQILMPSTYPYEDTLAALYYSS